MQSPVFGPKGLEVHCEADLATSVHFGCLAVKLRYADLRSRYRIGGRYIEFEVEFVLEKLMYIPALTKPVGAILVRADCEPVAV